MGCDSLITSLSQFYDIHHENPIAWQTDLPETIPGRAAANGWLEKE